MSTTYEIYPTSSYIPTKEEIGKLAEKYLNIFFEKNNIEKIIKITNLTFKNVTIRLLWKEYEKIKSINNKNITVNEMEYDGYNLSIEDGNTIFVFFHEFTQLDIKVLKEMLINTKYENEFEKVARLSYTWTVKRTMGQPKLAVLMFNFLAIAIAELTDGIIYSGDGAWDIEIFPLKAKEFLPILLEKTFEELFKDWVYFTE